MVEPEIPLSGGSHSKVTRVGQTVRRVSRSAGVSSAVFDLLRHLERQGFTGAPRALGFDDDGREILTYIEGEVAAQRRPGHTGGGDLPAYVWRDDVLLHLGTLVRGYHDAAATFPWAGREWLLETRQPVETICHNEIFPWNTVFREGVPIAFIDWDTAAPGPRAWEIGFIAWHWVPFWHDEQSQAAGLPTGVAEKARRFRLLLDAYGTQPDITIVQSGIERMQSFLAHMQKFAADGSEWEVQMAQRGVFDELALTIEWVKTHATTLVGT
ncbi:MAG: aminoglycoside phosphotransferase family protein [Chloroflexi bacterium]|nr:aminoglycoside phosphotransferase family protein [Chloroflexota bacterium]MCC6891556.1 aminoglycoside phosphotransferase family protein [Anaerolineae bacterium]